MYSLSKSRNNFLLHVSVDHRTSSTFYPNIAIQISKLVDSMIKKSPPSLIEKRILGTYCARFKILCQDEKEQVWRLAEGAETSRVLALWALQMKHTSQQEEKCINGGGCHPRITRDQGTWIYRGWMKNSYLVLHEKTLCKWREGVFSEQAYEGEGDAGPVKYCRFVRLAYC